MAKQIKTQRRWGMYNPAGDLWGVGSHRKRADFIAWYFRDGKWKTVYKPRGWRCVRVRVEVVEKKRSGR